MGTLAILDQTGDSRLQWDKGDMSQVEAARKRFNEFRSKGYATFRVNNKGNQGEQIDSFDPDAERILAIPAMVGG